MKTGVILYISGAGEKEYDMDVTDLARGLHIDADRVEAVFNSSANIFDVMDAWWKLSAKGMCRIVCKFVKITEDSICLTGRELRLCG